MSKYESNIIAIKKAIEIVGGVAKLATMLDVSYQTVLNWKNGRYLTSPINCQKIEKITDKAVKKEDILPNFLWND